MVDEGGRGKSLRSKVMVCGKEKRMGSDGCFCFVLCGCDRQGGSRNSPHVPTPRARGKECSFRETSEEQAQQL